MLVTVVMTRVTVIYIICSHDYRPRDNPDKSRSKHLRIKGEEKEEHQPIEICQKGKLHATSLQYRQS